MRSCFLTLMLVCLVTHSFAQNQLDTLRRKDVDGWEFVQVRNFKKVVLEGNMHNGNKEGVWTEYLPTEYPSSATSYANGKKNGTKIGINGAGRVEYVENYKDDKLEGPRKVYNTENGRMTESAYYSEGKKHGNYTKWYGNGKVQETGVYVYDVRDGLSTWYSGNGNKSVEYNYRAGKMDGDAATYFENGKVNSHGRYANDKQEGTWKEYYENGSLKAEGEYKNGNKEGAWKEYDSAGTLLKTVTYKKGETKK